MNAEQKAVVLDAAQEMQYNETWWEQFEYRAVSENWVICCFNINPLTYSIVVGFEFRRKPRTVTVTMPVPSEVVKSCKLRWRLHVDYATRDELEAALAAFREAMGDE